MKKVISYLLLFSLLLCSCSTPIPSEASKEVPFGGNAYLTAGNGKVEKEGISIGTDPAAMYSAYFRVNTVGTLNLFLIYKTDTDNAVKVECEGKKFSVNLPKDKNTVFVGTLKVQQPGYIQLNIQPAKETESKLVSLLIDGPASVDANFVGDFSFYWGRRGPSVHLKYTMPKDKDAEWFYNELRVPQGEDVIGSYFMSNGFGEGYFGIQVNSEEERRVLFSVWSPYNTDDPASIPDDQKIICTKKGEDVHTGEFGNEGAGGQSYLRYNWKADNTYKFLTHVRPADKGYTEYTSYFFAPEKNEWKLIASFLRPNTKTYYTRAHSFLENFHPDGGYQSRKVYFRNQWIYTTTGEWIPLTEAGFTIDETGRNKARMDYKGGVDENGFFLQNCGFFSDYVEPGSTFQQKCESKKPDIDFNAFK